MDAIKMKAADVVDEILRAVTYFYEGREVKNQIVVTGWTNLIALAAIESKLDPGYKHPSASAKGLFAITDDIQKKYGGAETHIIHNQVATALRYIEDCYESAEAALNFRVEKGFW